MKRERIEAFFEYARKREAVRIAKESGAPSPWTSDLILQNWRFCNVFREDDRTTVWFAKNIRDTLAMHPQIILATIVFRWFNRIETGQAIWSYYDPLGRSAWQAAWDAFVDGEPLWADVIGRTIRERRPKGPWVTGAYIIKTPDGKDKLDGVIWCLNQFNVEKLQRLARNAASLNSLESFHLSLTEFPYMGDFMAYEVVTDLAHAPVLREAPDRMTWANPGPGAARGLCRLLEAPLDDLNRGSIRDRAYMMQLMKDLLHASKDPTLWPELWDHWDMRTVEHTLCEFDKYERVKSGGRLKQRFTQNSG